ncbi:hypothetical protein E2562_009641 [Oryza meyeriana var. granulata]|uniref:Uncharacterized protein n=1 Tax=Oryza meyeriana var. granulata TaxID=110450 RepID=A0A6G1D2B5_9ORYZ|nr:hypothetical protein E2562_009641 [Oryza meyeriana var. granulata]
MAGRAPLPMEEKRHIYYFYDTKADSFSRYDSTKRRRSDHMTPDVMGEFRCFKDEMELVERINFGNEDEGRMKIFMNTNGGKIWM